MKLSCYVHSLKLMATLEASYIPQLFTQISGISHIVKDCMYIDTLSKQANLYDIQMYAI